MRTLIGIAVLAALAGCGGGGAATQVAASPTAVPVLQMAPLDQSLVVFIGDSITYWWDQPNYVAPANELGGHLVNFVDAGIGGEVSSQMLARFQTDVLSRYPGTIVILAGTNDVQLLQTADTSSLFTMIGEAEATGAKVIVGTLPPNVGWAHLAVDPSLGDRLIASFNEQIVTGAKEYGYTVVDYHAVLVNSDGTQNASLFLLDGVHPNDAGYQVMWPLLAKQLPASIQVKL